MRTLWLLTLICFLICIPLLGLPGLAVAAAKSPTKRSLVQKAKARVLAVKESVSDASQNAANTITAVVGGIAYCDDKGGITADELQRIDKCTHSNFQGSFGDITRLAYYSEQLILNDLAEEAEASVDCHLPFLTSYSRSMKEGKPTAEAADMNQRAFKKFSERRSQIASAYKALQDLEKSPPGSVGERPSDVVIAEHAKKVSDARLKLNAMTVDMPLGTTEPVRQQIFKLAAAGTHDLATFSKSYATGINDLKNSMTEFKDELRDGKQIVDSRGTQFFNFSKMPKFREELMLSDRYDTALVNLGATENARRNLQCRRNAEFKVGRSRASAGLLGLSILSMGASFGTSALIAGAAEGAMVATVGRATHLALQMGVAASDVALAAGGTLSACSEKTSIIPAAGKTCTDKEAFEGIINRANASECYASLGTGAAALAIPIAGVAFTNGVKSFVQRVETTFPKNPQIKIWQLSEAGDDAAATSLRSSIESHLENAPIADVEALKWGLVKKGGIVVPKKMSKLGGATGARLVTLNDGTKAIWKPKAGSRWASGDAEIGVYEVDKALGTNMVPISVRRSIDGEEGTLHLFVDDLDKNVIREDTPEHLRWFDSLIKNADRHGENYLSHEGRVVAIDHGASLRPDGALSNSKHRANLNFDPDIRSLMAETKIRRRTVLPPRESLPTVKDPEAAAIIEQYRELRYDAPNANRLRAITLLPPKAAYQKLVATDEKTWRDILKRSGTPDEAVQGFVTRRKTMIENVERAKKVWGPDILREGNIPPVVKSSPVKNPIPIRDVELKRREMALTDNDLLKPLTPKREWEIVFWSKHADSMREEAGRGVSYYDRRKPAAERRKPPAER